MTKQTAYKLSDVARNEWKMFAMYTIESRAIPNMIDGMKPVHRFFLYSSLINSRRKFEKVGAIAGVVSGYGYHHGEASAASAGQLMAAEWANNICLIKGRGFFGTRLVNEAAAPRYTFTKVHDNFDKYIRDVDLAPVHSDPEHIPPAFYIPVIPLVLVNGVKGIGTGFKTDILPRNPVQLAQACREYIETGHIQTNADIMFPEFTGKVTYDPERGRYVCTGTITKKSKTVAVIDEVPYGIDHETYVEILDKIEEQGLIVGYEDCCDENGFRFEVKLKAGSSVDWDEERMLKEFKLIRYFNEILTVIGPDGKLREYKAAEDLIKDFCDFRLGILDKRIALRIDEYQEEVRWLTVKQQFVQAVLDNAITFKGHKRLAVVEQILANTEAAEQDCDRLLRINIMSLTAEMVQQLKQEIASAKKELAIWQKTTRSKQFIMDLDSII